MSVGRRAPGVAVPSGRGAQVARWWGRGGVRGAVHRSRAVRGGRSPPAPPGRVAGPARRRGGLGRAVARPAGLREAGRAPWTGNGTAAPGRPRRRGTPGRTIGRRNGTVGRRDGAGRGGRRAGGRARGRSGGPAGGGAGGRSVGRSGGRAGGGVGDDGGRAGGGVGGDGDRAGDEAGGGVGDDGGRAGGQDGGGAPRVGRTLFVLLITANFVINYTSTAMNVALSDIVDDLGTSLTGVQSVISLYALVVAACLITGSKLGARHGDRRAFVVGGRIFAVGALVTALGPTLPFMLVGWSLLQGAGVALMLPALVSLLTESFTGAARTKALSALGVSAGVASGVAPVAGGLISHYLSWRVSFLLSTVITFAVVLLMRRQAGPEPRTRPDRRFDNLGALLSAAGFGLLVVATLLAGRYGLIEDRQDFQVLGVTLLSRGQVSPVPLLVGAGLVVLAVLAGWERRLIKRGRDPLVRLVVLRDRRIGVGSLTLVMLFLVPSGMLFLVPVFLQTTAGFDALRSGITLISMPVALSVGASMTVRLVGSGRMTHRTAQLWAFSLMAAGCAAVAVMFGPWCDVSAIGLALTPGLLLVGFGRGMATTANDLVQSAAPPEEVSDVTGLSRTATYLGSSFGVALAGAFMTTTLLLAFEAGAEDSTVLSSAQRQRAVYAVEHQVQITAATDEAVRAGLASRGVTGAAADELVRVNAEARGRALAVAALGMGALAVVGFLLALGLPRGPATSAVPAAPSGPAAPTARPPA
ncbi:MFS transporter [Streptomyces fradiae]|uniref:MFS transporter n=1 Tax=Streptomyces fradiae TaxID=1906 RepID=UPI003681A500